MVRRMPKLSLWKSAKKDLKWPVVTERSYCEELVLRLPVEQSLENCEIRNQGKQESLKLNVPETAVHLVQDFTC